jgi:CO dehydrogenase maturation factor
MLWQSLMHVIGEIHMDNLKKNTKIIAVAGKGGVGKTSLAAVMVKLLVSAFPDKKILAIDADPAVGLSTVLNIDVTTTIDDIRKEVVKTVEDGETKSAIELLSEAKYQIYDAISEQDGYAFIAIGRPESAGCYCKINSYLKEVITMISGNFDYVVIDGEAGIEQINRRVMEKVSHLILVTDASKKGCQVVQTIKKVADELVMYEKIGVVANRIPDSSVTELMDIGDLPLVAAIEADKELAACDMKGENVFYLPENARIVEGARKALVNMEILG